MLRFMNCARASLSYACRTTRLPRRVHHQYITGKPVNLRIVTDFPNRVITAQPLSIRFMFLKAVYWKAWLVTVQCAQKIKVRHGAVAHHSEFWTRVRVLHRFSFLFRLLTFACPVLATTSTTITGRSGDSCTWWRWSIPFGMDRAVVLFRGSGTDHVQAAAPARQQEPMSTRRPDLDFDVLLYVDLTALFGTLSYHTCLWVPGCGCTDSVQVCHSDDAAWEHSLFKVSENLLPMSTYVIYGRHGVHELHDGLL
jgi:hypothetical protein